MHIIYYITVFGMLALFSGTVIWALWWAVRGGQLSRFQHGATSIFDDDEPLGQVTDAFPGQQRQTHHVSDEETRRP